jgi:hypothetical protein
MAIRTMGIIATGITRKRSEEPSGTRRTFSGYSAYLPNGSFIGQGNAY